MSTHSRGPCFAGDLVLRLFVPVQGGQGAQDQGRRGAAEGRAAQGQRYRLTDIHKLVMHQPIRPLIDSPTSD